MMIYNVIEIRETHEHMQLLTGQGIIDLPKASFPTITIESMNDPAEIYQFHANVELYTH